MYTLRTYSFLDFIRSYYFELKLFIMWNSFNLIIIRFLLLKKYAVGIVVFLIPWVGTRVLKFSGYYSGTRYYRVPVMVWYISYFFIV